MCIIRAYQNQLGFFVDRIDISSKLNETEIEIDRIAQLGVGKRRISTRELIDKDTEELRTDESK